ncbi:MAG: IPT/TIG domain-containing protein [Aphanocapsa lilacina HA4352-LM1]|nr:IPT/TIG domain-containing protein [Aphanocapsa lilacina HA4352-LM1]
MSVCAGRAGCSDCWLFGVPAAIEGLSPRRGPVGTQVSLTGSGLAAATAVTFKDGITASFTVVSDSELLVTVPAAARSGRVSVNTPTGSAASRNRFRVTP